MSMELSEKIKYLRLQKDWTLGELAEKIGVSASTIMRYEKGEISNLKRDKIKILADVLDTTPAYLMGWEDQLQTLGTNIINNASSVTASAIEAIEVLGNCISKDTPLQEKSTLPEGAISIDMQKVLRLPVLGSIRCGEPMFAESNIEGYEYIHTSLIRGEEDHFCLRAKGDSMSNVGILEGDLLLIRKQSDVDNGDIAVVTLNGDEATLKRVFKKQLAIVLQPESSNPDHKTKIFTGKEMELVQIQGRLMNVIKKF